MDTTLQPLAVFRGHARRADQELSYRDCDRTPGRRAHLGVGASSLWVDTIAPPMLLRMLFGISKQPLRGSTWVANLFLAGAGAR